MTDKTDNRLDREAGETNPHACREGFEQQRKAGINVDWFTWQIAWHDAMFTQVDTKAATQPKALTDEQREAIRVAIAESLGEAYDCMRVWSAWGYGTMGPNDFALVAEDEARLDEITDAAINALIAATEAK